MISRFILLIFLLFHQILLHPCLALPPLSLPPATPPLLARAPNCYSRRAPYPPITASDCSLAVREMIAEGTHAADPTTWGPGIDHRIAWAWGTCGILLIPNSVQSFDTISRLKLAEEARRVVEGCVTQAYGYKGGFVKVGGKGVFHLVVAGKVVGMGEGRREE